LLNFDLLYFKSECFVSDIIKVVDVIEYLPDDMTALISVLMLCKC